MRCSPVLLLASASIDPCHAQLSFFPMWGIKSLEQLLNHFSLVIAVVEPRHSSPLFEQRENRVSIHIVCSSAQLYAPSRLI